MTAPVVRIGILVRGQPALLADTLTSLQRASTHAAVSILASIEGARLPAARDLDVVECETTRGAPHAFNRLIAGPRADIYVLLESGARVAPAWLERLIAALQTERSHGLAGPSTNRCWNEQAALPQLGPAWPELSRAASEARDRFGAEYRYLEPLHSLNDFCYAVRREVVERLGAADEGYGEGPCWEMDYNVRAARAGFRGVWACSAVVWRPFDRQRALREATLFDASKRRYQDSHCGLRQRGVSSPYHRHCAGDACRYFAPPDRLSLRRELPAMPEPPAAPSPQPGAGLVQLERAEPLVSCIMPTRDRREHVGAAIAAFQAQTYENRELIVLDDGDDEISSLVPSDPRIRYVRPARSSSLGAKRNAACRLAAGELIAHWDDDDWHAPWRLRYQVAELLQARADICGTDRLWFYDPQADAAFQYRYAGTRGRWLAGGTFCYRRRIWQAQPFADITLGEDTRFVRELGGRRVHVLEQDDFYVARLHPRNTSRKHTTGTSWRRVPSSLVRGILARHRPEARRPVPLVSCIMPTRGRRPFVSLSLERFAEQDYPNLELIVVDDGEDQVGDLVGAASNVTHVTLRERRSIGEKRNLACARACGSLIVHWDDDDWYGPGRVSRQVEPLLAGRASITGLQSRHFMTLPDAQLWRISSDEHRRMFMADVHGGTLTFERRIWEAGVRYPHVNLAEDAAFLREALRRGERLERVVDADDFVYMRHGRNAWQFNKPENDAWRCAERPEQLTSSTVDRYREASLTLGAPSRVVTSTPLRHG